jgi:hypothetical protein
MKNQNLLIALGIGAIAYFAYMEMQKKKNQQSGDESEGDESKGQDPKLSNQSLNSQKWIELCRQNPEIFKKVQALQVGLNVVLTQLGDPNIKVDGELGDKTQAAITRVFGDHYGVLKAGDVKTLDYFLITQARINAQKKDDVRFLSNDWFANLWK